VDNASKNPVLKLLVIIIDRDKTERIKNLLQKERIGLQYILHGQGTASSEMMDLLGLGQVDKSVILCIDLDYRIEELMRAASRLFQFKLPGQGISFTVPINGLSSPVLRLLSDDTSDSKPEDEVDRMQSEITHDIILAVINQGYSEELMTAAKTAGARGGTVLHARRIAGEEALKFLGISIREDKEIVAIVTSHAMKNGIMQAISQKCGIKTEARGLVISLPVDGVAGIVMADEE